MRLLELTPRSLEPTLIHLPSLARFLVCRPEINAIKVTCGELECVIPFHIISFDLYNSFVRQVDTGVVFIFLGFFFFLQFF